MKNIGIIVLTVALFITACDNDGGTTGFNNSSNNANNTTNNITNNVNNNNVNNNNVNNVQMAILRGRVMGPGSDDITVGDHNRFPVPGALVAVYTSGISAPPDGNYCNECVELPTGVNFVYTDVDGYFELEAYPNTTLNLLVQKGEFRKVTSFSTPGPGEAHDFEAPVGMPSNPETTLPNTHNPEAGMWIPRIAIIKGSWEKKMNMMLEALGFQYDGDRIIEVLPYHEEISFDPTEADMLLADPTELAKYNIIVITCGGSVSALADSTEKNNLRQWVNNGGKLYVDDFSYDWAEQPWPDFLSFWVEQDEDANSVNDACGEGSSADYIDSCNNWTSYSPSGVADDQALAEWIALSDVNRGESLTLHAAWDIIHELSPGPWGACQEVEPDCRDGVAYHPPKVWVRGDAPGHPNNPMTVGWNYFCGKVLYTVYHTHAEDATGDPKAYNMLLQEKIMMYLLMEISTCTKPPVVE